MVNNTGIPPNLHLQSYSPNLPFNIPSPPAIYSFQETNIEDLHLAFYISDTPTLPGQIESSIVSQIKNMILAGQGDNSKVDFVAESNHRPMCLNVGPVAIREGLYGDMGKLQGVRGTWWVSATWHTHDSALIWRKIEGMLGNITAAVN